MSQRYAARRAGQAGVASPAGDAGNEWRPGWDRERLQLSRHLAEQLLARSGAGAVPVTIGDMTGTRVPGAPFTLIYLVANTIMNGTTQDDQLAVFANAAAYLEPGCCFVVEVIVPPPPGTPEGKGWAWQAARPHGFLAGRRKRRVPVPGGSRHE